MPRELHGICGDRRTMRYVGDGMVLSQARCAEWIEESRVDYATRGYGASAVYVQGEPVMAGYCGIVTARRRADPEIIYALRPHWWGQGSRQRTRAGAAAVWFRAPAACHDWWPRSGRRTARPLRVVEKAGMHCAGEELAAEGILMLIYALDAL